MAKIHYRNKKWFLNTCTSQGFRRDGAFETEDHFNIDGSQVGLSFCMNKVTAVIPIIVNITTVS